MSNFKKIRAVGAELFLADRRTHVMKLIVNFVSFSNVPKNRVTTEGMTRACNNLTEPVAHAVFFILYIFALYLHVKRFY
jgi:hypothetical protein